MVYYRGANEIVGSPTKKDHFDEIVCNLENVPAGVEQLFVDDTSNQVIRTGGNAYSIGHKDSK